MSNKPSVVDSSTTVKNPKLLLVKMPPTTAEPEVEEPTLMMKMKMSKLSNQCGHIPVQELNNGCTLQLAHMFKLTMLNTSKLDHQEEVMFTLSEDNDANGEI